MAIISHFILLTILNIWLISESVSSLSVYFQPEREYRFDYDGSSTIKDVGTFTANSKIGIVQLGLRGNDTQHCLLQVHYYRVRVNAQEGRVSENVHMADVDFSNWLSFDMDLHGHIGSIYYDPVDTDSHAVELKKKILGVLSNKLMISELAESDNSRWAYTALEYGEEGHHTTTYQAEPDTGADTIVFKKKKITPDPIHSFDQKYEKEVHLDRKLNIPKHSKVHEEFITLKEDRNPIPRRATDEDINKINEEYDFPVMQGNGQVSLTFDKVVAIDAEALWNQRPHELVSDTLHFRQIPKPMYDRTVAMDYIQGNITCMQHSHRTEAHESKIRCFHDITSVMARLTAEDLRYIVLTYSETDERTWSYIVDALGTTQTNDSLVFMAELVFSPYHQETFNVTMSALAQVIRLDTCPPKALRHSLFVRVFDRPWLYDDAHQTNLVNERGLLVLGNVARATRECNSTWSDMVTYRLQDLAGFHDPYEHRVKRGALSKKDFKRHVSLQAVHIMALSNDHHPSSYNYLLSYVNDTESHIQLRCSAVRGIGRYDNGEAASVLLAVGMNDPDETVRHKALDAYELHPQGGDIRNFLVTQEYRYSNLTAPDHKRMRRDLQDVASKIWRGFKFRLESPSLNWQKMIGGTKLGASMGLIIQNFLDLDIAPLKGDAKVNVYDKAYATAHLGLLGFDFHIFLADLCYKGSIEYDLNILAEYDFEEVAKIARKIDKVIETVVDKVSWGITNFKNIVSAIDGINIEEIIADFIDVVRAIPQKVYNLRKVPKKLLRAMDEYTNLPPVMVDIRNFIRKVMTIFNDVKSDVMGMYNAVVDPIETTLPWAWDQIMTAFNGMAEAIPNILQNPLTSLQDIGRGIVRISLAIGAVIDAKDTLVEANIFATANRPYWFDFQTVFSDLMNDTVDIATNLNATYDYLYDYDERSTNIANDYTGVPIEDLKYHAMAELWSHIMGELIGPFDTLRTLLDPFILTYQLITKVVERAKNAWATLVNGYNYARTLFDAIFGKKFHKRFPNKVLVSQRCGDGFYKSRGQGHYDHPGIDLSADVGADVVAPFSGNIRVSGTNQITIKANEVKNMEVIIDNVAYNTFRPKNKVIGAGEIMGTVTNSWCARGHIHVAMRNNRTRKYTDPTRFKQQRPGLPASWNEDCDHYELVFLGVTLQVGSITADPVEEDETPVLENAPDPASLQSTASQSYDTSRRSSSSRRRGKRTLETFVDRFQNFTTSLGLGLIDDLTQIFSLRLNNISLDAMMTFLATNGITDLHADIDNALELIQELGNYETCTRPETMDDKELHTALFVRGISSAGSRPVLESRLRIPDTVCDSLSGTHLHNDTVCTFDPDCLGLSCCLEVTVFDLYRYSIVGFVKYDPCQATLSIGADSWSVVIPVDEDFDESSDTVMLDVNPGNLNVVQMVALYEVSLEDSTFTVKFGLGLCSSLKEECSDLMKILDSAQIPQLACEDATADSNQLSSSLALYDTSVTVADFIDQLDNSGLSEEEVVDIVDQIRDAFVLWVEEQIEQAFIEIFDNILNHNDMCMRGFDLNFGPYQVEIFRTRPPIRFPIGWFTLVFEFGLNGYYGAYFHCDLCILSMKAKAKVTPVVGAVAWGSIGIAFGPFQVRLLLEGAVMTTEFPTTAEITFNKWPLDLKAAMDLKLTPLKLTFFAEILFQLNLGFVSISETILSIKLWEYTSPTIHKRIFGNEEIEPDLTPPQFMTYEEQEPGTSSSSTSSSSSSSSSGRSGRRRRQAGGVPCEVYQVTDKDYTEPAFHIQYGVADDKSECETTLCIGTYVGGCNVLDSQPLGGPSSEHSRTLVSGLPLYFTVTSANSGGGTASVTCDIPTYDTTLPTGRVTAEYLSTSHPNILRCTMFVSDDSEINVQQVSAGYGNTAFSSQIVQWTAFSTDVQSSVMSSGGSANNPLSFFAVPKKGRLVFTPFVTTEAPTDAACGAECLDYPVTKCMGYNFDYGPTFACELLHTIEGHATVEESGAFYYFERRGVGSTSNLDIDDVSLVHDSLVYCSVYMENVLGYENYMISEGIHVDFTPPDPGENIAVLTDTLLVEDCTAFTPTHMHHRCSEQTSLPNYRFIGDVEYENCTLCNGHTPGEEVFYTLANRMVSINFDDIHDNETGILVYTWAVGRTPCETDVHPHTDPHAHIFEESEWTHQGVAFPLELEDGIYHVSLTALNEVDFGGPMALHICHQTPYIIDTTPPVINNTDQAMYDPETHNITMNVTAYDDLSGIVYHQLGLGRSQRDTYIRFYENVESEHELQMNHEIPNGIPTWVKVRVANRVALRSVDHSPRAIFIDASPPLGGEVFIGTRVGVHQEYQSSTTELCATWIDFYDGESGLSMYVLGFGTGAGLDDVMEFTELAITEYSYCQSGLDLQHNTEYFATLVAWNGATITQSVNGSSAAVLVDTTAPTEGVVRDGVPDEGDTVYSASSSTIAVTWSGFADPESGIESVTVLFKKSGPSGDTVLHEEDGVPADATDLEFHHFNLNHGDYVYTQVNVTNGALLSTDSASDGFLIDLTDPVMSYLVDGPLTNQDLRYSASTSSVSANWQYSDPDSGITSYQAAVFTIAAGLTQQIYPATANEWITLSSDTTTWATDDVLSLTPGHLYFTRVKATNGASLTSVYDTDGVLIDPTPPQMLYVRAGVLSGESEEAVDGYVRQNDPTGIRGSWRALDAESGVMEYVVGIGTSEGADDVRAFTEMTDEDAYMGGLSLELTDRDLATPAPVYYITVKAQNGAAEYSDLVSSSPIMLLEEDREGLVWDGTGASMEDNIDYQLDRDIVSMRFTGFESALHGIDRYEWAIGSQPRYDDVMPFTSYGIIVTDESSFGLGSSGFALITFPLRHGQRYYMTVRATTGAGNTMDVSSDGVTIDTAPPSAAIVRLHDNNDVAGVENVYQADAWLEAEWTATDEEGMVTQTWVAVGTVPGGDDIYTTTLIDGIELAQGTATPAVDGQPNFITVTVANQNGLQSTTTSPSIAIDDTPPTEGTVECPVFATGNIIKCSLWNFVDLESGLQHFEVALGYSEGDSSVSAFMEISPGSDDFSIAFNSLNDFGQNQEYYVTVFAVNNALLRTRAFSDAIYVDNTPPEGAAVIELMDHESFDVDANEHSYPEAIAISANDAVCQRDITRVHIAWGEFTDEETGIAYYDLALGTAQGGTQIADYTSVDPTRRSHVFKNLNLGHVRTVYATVRGYNHAGLHNTVFSNGVHISRVSAGLLLSQPLVVYDGTRTDDLDFQNQLDSLGATWRLDGDPCPFTEKQWSVRRFDGLIISELDDLPEDEDYGYVDEVNIHDKQSFYVTITAKNMLNHTVQLHSDGITVKLEPVIPGSVRDGVIPGTDLSYQTSNNSIGCHWEGFGVSRLDGNFDSRVEGSPDVDIEVGEHQTMERYEVAIGTDRTTHESRTDIRPFTDVGTNTSWVFHDLDLEMGTSIYYCTVRAYSVSTASTQVTSNGIRVGHGGRVISHGNVVVDRYVASESSVMLAWEDFEFSKPILRYYWGLAAGNVSLASLDPCDTLALNWQTHEVTDVHQFQDAGMDAIVSPTDLSLTHSYSYTVIVVALDQSGTCDVAVEMFTVDITPPVEGTLQLVNSVELAVLYTDQQSTVAVEWIGYIDEESDIATATLTLYTTSDCNPDPNDLESLTLVATDTLPGAFTNYTFMDLELEYDTPYFVLLHLINGASLTITNISKPIVLDILPPSSGLVIDGNDLLLDKTFQNDTTQVTATMLYLPSSTVACSLTVYDEFSEDDEFVDVVHKGLWNFPEGKQSSAHFLTSQVEYSEDGDTLLLNAVRRVSEQVMKCSAVALQPEAFNVGEYEFRMQIADKTWATTAISFWDGRPNILVAPTNLTSSSSSSSSSSGRIRIYPQPLEGDTFSGGYSQSFVHGNGFGVLIRVIDDGEELGTELVLWGKSGDEYRETTRELSSDVSDDMHLFRISINEERVVTDMRDWDMKLYVDDKLEALLGGIHGVSENASMVVGVFNHDDFVPEVIDVFSPPAATTQIDYIQLPTSDDTACQPFQGGDHPIVEFHAGIGTEAGVTDVLPYQLVSSPGLPCSSACDELFCDPDTAESDLQAITFTLSDLDLDPYSNDTIGDDDSEYLQQAYFVTVKGLVGSGKSAIASSNGFYVDITPPQITTILHFDVEYDDYEPVRFQGNNHTIQVVFYSEDSTSGVAENFWAIGTAPYETDIQEYVSVGTSQLAINTNLSALLENHVTYYATIKSLNNAGLFSYNASRGVKVLLDRPLVNNTHVGMPGTTEVGSEETNAVSTSSQTNFSAQFDTPDPSQNIESVNVGMGTSEGQNDVCPSTRAGYNSSNTIVVSDQGTSVGPDGYQDLDTSVGRSEFRRRRRSSGSGQMLVDPGRVMQFHIEMCNGAHLCGTVPTPYIFVVRDTDSVASADGDGLISTSLASDMTSGSNSITLDISTANTQNDGAVLVTGVLSEQDMQGDYHSAGGDFNASVVDPQATISQTSRRLYGRVTDVTSSGFYMTASPSQPISGPTFVTFSFDRNEYPDSGLEPRLLAYCPNSQIWIDAGETCLSGAGTVVDWDAAVCNVSVCNVEAHCADTVGTGEGSSSRRRRDADDGFTGSSSFVVASASLTVVNWPPILDSDANIAIDEDPGIVEITLEGIDPENDTFEFLLSENSEHVGNVSLATDGVLRYQPCEDCFGQDFITIILREVRDDDIEVEESVSVINISVIAVNDNPRLVVMQDGDCLSDDTYQVTLVTEEYSPDKTDYVHLEILFGGYDVDGDRVNIYYGTVENGDVLIQNQIETDEFTEQDCSQSWELREEAWSSLMHDITENTPGIVMLVPCDMPEDVTDKVLQWTLSLARYTPDVGFYGIDTIQVNSNDDSNSLLPSELLEVTVYVLANPCLNGATCVGPESDLDCTSLDRSNGFDGYACDCAKGFKGSNCETNVDDCKANSCELGYKCVDEVDGFKCECQTGSCLIPAWAIVLIVITVLAIIAIVVLSVIIYFLRKRKGNDKEEEQLLDESLGLKGENNKAYDDEADDFITPAAPVATSMPTVYQTKQEMAYAQDSQPDYQPAASAQTDDTPAAQKTIDKPKQPSMKSKLAALTGFKSKKEGIPKQPQGAKNIKVKGAAQPKMDPQKRHTLQKWGAIMGVPEKKAGSKQDVQEPDDILFVDDGQRTSSKSSDRPKSASAWNEKGSRPGSQAKKGTIFPEDDTDEMEMQKMNDEWMKKNFPGLQQDEMVIDTGETEDKPDHRTSTPKLHLNTLKELNEDTC